MADEVLDILDDILDNGTDIPARVSNRLLLAAVRKNYRISADNSEAIARNLSVVTEALIPRIVDLEEHSKEHCGKIEKVSLWKDRTGNVLVALVIGMAMALAVVGWHTGVDFGWWPGF